MRDCGGRRAGRDKTLTGSAKEMVIKVGLGSDKQGKGCGRVRPGTAGIRGGHAVLSAVAAAIRQQICIHAQYRGRRGVRHRFFCLRTACCALTRYRLAGSQVGDSPIVFCY